MKLAVRYGITSRKPVADSDAGHLSDRAAEELRSYAAILGIGCEVLETTAALAQALEEHRQKDLILIDTPGLASGEMDGFEELARFLSSYPGMDTHLVLPASMRTSDLKRAAERYEIFRPRKLLFTRLDETETFGPILSQSVRMGKPVSFLVARPAHSRGSGAGHARTDSRSGSEADRAGGKSKFGTAAA